MTPSLQGLVSAAAFLCLACAFAGDWRETPPAGTESGDIAFRRGNGPWTRFFVGASTRDRRFSHVGVVVPSPGGGVAVIHSEADDFTGKGSVRMEPWDVFFKDALDGAVYRYSGNGETAGRIASAAAKRAGVPFDTSFDLSDTNRLYCSEFVREAVNEAAGCPLVGTTRTKDREIVAIDDIYRLGFVKIFDFGASPP